MNFKHYFDDKYLDKQDLENNRKAIKVDKKVSNKGKFVIQNGKMLFQRVGPMAGQHQEAIRAPEKKGIWAFPYPIFDWFFVGSSYSSPAKHSPKIHHGEPEKDQIEISLADRLFLQKELKKIATSKDYSYYDGDIINALKDGKIQKSILHELKFRKERHKHPQFKVKKFFWDGPVYSHISPKHGVMGMDRWHRYDRPDHYLAELRKHVFQYMKDFYTNDKLAKIKVDKMGRTGMFSIGADEYEVFVPMK